MTQNTFPMLLTAFLLGGTFTATIILKGETVEKKKAIEKMERKLDSLERSRTSLGTGTITWDSTSRLIMPDGTTKYFNRQGEEISGGGSNGVLYLDSAGTLKF